MLGFPHKCHFLLLQELTISTVNASSSCGTYTVKWTDNIDTGSTKQTRDCVTLIYVWNSKYWNIGAFVIVVRSVLELFLKFSRNMQPLLGHLFKCKNKTNLILWAMIIWRDKHEQNVDISIACVFFYVSNDSWAVLKYIFLLVWNALKTEYSQTCIRQPPKGMPINGCLRQVLAYYI